MAVKVQGTSPPKRTARRRRKQRNLNGLIALATLTILVNCVFIWAAWGLMQGSSSEASNPIALVLPAPTETPAPTARPTSVVIATSTPAQGRPASLSLSDVTGALIPKVPTATPIPSLPPVGDSPAPAPPSPTPQPEIRQVMIISIDGLRPDALFVAETPTLDRLIAQGSYCPTAQTVNISVTLPSHASMLTGMIPEKHGLLWNAPYIGWTGMTGPTLFSVAHEAGMSTAMIFGKEKMNYLVLPNSVDQVIGADVHDAEVKDRAIEVIRAGLPKVSFIHFPDVDRVGHSNGWMSPNQFEAVRFVDGLIGEIVAELERNGYLSSTLLIITADHGGHGTGHGDDSPEDRTIPWLAVGPGVPAGVTLTRKINTYDTAATVLHALKLTIPGSWDGQPVREIFP